MFFIYLSLNCDKMSVVFVPPSTYDFQKLLGGDRYGNGLADISIFKPKRGSGLFSFIAKRAIPFLIKSVKPVAKNIIEPVAKEFGKSVVKDVVLDGKPLKQSLHRRGKRALKATARKLVTGSGRVTKKTTWRRKRKKTTKHIKDIYSLV